MSWNKIQSNSASAKSVAYTTNLTAGTKLIVLVSVYQSTATAVTDNNSNSFTKLVSSPLNGSTSSFGELSLWALDTPTGDVGTKPTISVTTGSSFVATLVQEVSGLLAGNTSAMLDGTAAISHASGSTSLACGAYGTTAADEYLIAVYGDDQNNDGTNPSACTGSSTYTLDAKNVASGMNVSVAYGNSTGGTETATFTIAPSSDDQATIFVAFNLASSGVDSTAANASATSDLGDGLGTWVNLTNAEGAADASYATWTAP